MIQEDQNQMCDNSSCGDESNVVRSSTSSKKWKQTKVPQRGLGVAQLEKIRIEEQQKKDAKHSPPPPPPPPPPLPPPPPPLIPSGPLLRTHSMPSIENFHSGSLPLLNTPSNGGVGFSLGWPTIPFHGNVNLPMLWNHELCNDQKRENNSSFLRDLSLPYETCSIAPVPNLLPKAHNYQHLQCSTSLVNNVSSTLMNSPCYSSVTSFLMEPPSNQSYVNNYLPSWPDDKKVMVGMKRACPFSIDEPPISKFRSKFAPISNPLIGTEESTSCQNGGTMHNLEPLIFRDFRSCPRVTHEPTTNPRKSSKSQTGNCNEELLTLAPATITQSFHNSVSRHLKALPYHVSYDDPFIDARHGGSSQQPRCISLFPSTELQVTSEPPAAPTSHNVCNGEVGENIDLNLRL